MADRAIVARKAQPIRTVTVSSSTSIRDHFGPMPVTSARADASTTRTRTRSAARYDRGGSRRPPQLRVRRGLGPTAGGDPPVGSSAVTGCGAVWLARLTGGQEVGSSNLLSPTRKHQVGGHNRKIPAGGQRVEEQPWEQRLEVAFATGGPAAATFRAWAVTIDASRPLALTDHVERPDGDTLRYTVMDEPATGPARMRPHRPPRKRTGGLLELGHANAAVRGRAAGSLGRGRCTDAVRLVVERVGDC